MARDQRGSRSRDWSQRQFRFARRGRAVTMGSIDRYVICATLASLAPIPLSLTGALRIARARAGAARLTPFGFDGGINPATGEFERASSAAFEAAGHSMSMMTNTLGRYFAGRFVVSAIGVFASIFVLLVLVDYIEMVRKTSGLATASAITVAETSLFRVPQLLEKMMPFCILIGAMTCYLALSRRLELVVARAAGVSAWQFIAPALASAIVLGILATTAYNPMSANLRELSKRMEARAFRLRSRAAAYRTQPVSGSIRSTATARPSSTPPAASSRACG